MKILHVVTVSEAGGAQSVVSALANAAVARGDEVAILSDRGGAMWNALDTNVGRIELDCLVKNIDPVRDMRAYFAIRRAIRSYKPDIVHLHSSKAGLFGRLFSGAYAKRTVYTVHGFDSIRVRHRVFIPLERALQRSCAAVVAVSFYDSANLKACGIEGNVRVIQNGVSDFLGILPTPGPALDSMRAAKAAGKFIVLSVARLSPPKRFDTFVAVARLMEGEDAAFFWVGNPEAVDGNGLPANFAALGDVFSAGSLMGECDAFVLLSDFEGLPMSVLEALSCGKPVVASRVGGIPEALADGAGILVGDDPRETAAAIRALMADMGGRNALGAVARSRYDERFTVGVMDREYLSLYREIAAAAGEA